MRLSDDEIKRVMAAVIAGCGRVDEHEIRRAIAWAAQTKVEAEFLRSILTGEYVIVNVPTDGGVVQMSQASEEQRAAMHAYLSAKTTAQ